MVLDTDRTYHRLTCRDNHSELQRYLLDQKLQYQIIRRRRNGWPIDGAYIEYIGIFCTEEELTAIKLKFELGTY